MHFLSASIRLRIIIIMPYNTVLLCTFIRELYPIYLFMCVIYLYILVFFFFLEQQVQIIIAGFIEFEHC